MTRMTFWKNAIQCADKLITSYVFLVRWTQLFNIFCSSLYGSVVWNLNHVCIAEVCVAWRKSVWRVWGLPADIHCELLSVICDSTPFLDVVFCRLTNFINCCLNRSSEIVNYVALVILSFFHECALQLVAMHYIVVSGMERGQKIYQLLILI